MLKVPVVHRAVVGRVLAHRRDDGTVREPHRAEIERREQGSGHAGSGSGLARSRPWSGEVAARGGGGAGACGAPAVLPATPRRRGPPLPPCAPAPIVWAFPPAPAAPPFPCRS